LERQ
jgi:hypothetical protein